MSQTTLVKLIVITNYKDLNQFLACGNFAYLCCQGYLYFGSRGKYFIVTSPEPSGSQGELIVYPCSGVRCRCRCQQCLNIFSSETAWPIKAKLYVEPPWEGVTKVYINGPGHMTKVAAMPIYGKNL